MMNELLKTVVARSYAVTNTVAGAFGALGSPVLTSTGSKFVLNAWAPMRLLKWGFLVDTTAIVTGGTNLVLGLFFNPTAGSVTNQVLIDTLTITDPNSAYVLGTGAYRDPYTASTTATTPASQVNTAGPLGNTANTTELGQQQFTLAAGQSWSISVNTAVTTSGAAALFIEYELLPISKPSGYGTTNAGTVSLTDNLTRLAS
jgi:hypothetical protein